MERTNLRELDALPEPVGLATLDLSFISLRLVLPSVRALLATDGPGGRPGQAAVRGGSRGGAARWRGARPGGASRGAARDSPRTPRGAGFPVRRLVRSPLTGADGNVEFLALLGTDGGLDPDGDRRRDRRADQPRRDGPAYYDAPRDEEADAPNRRSSSSASGSRGWRWSSRRLHEPSPDTMRQIVSLRMPDALLERVESAAHARGVSPSSLMRALIAAGLDRSYAAVAPDDLAAEVAALRRQVAAQIAERLAASGDRRAG